MKKRLLPQMLTLALVLMAMAAGCAHDGIKLGSARVVAAPSSQREAAAFFAEIGGDDGCFQIAHYLYRWQLDENDFKPRDLPLQRQLWLRRLQVVTDNNDKSQFLELVLPAIGVAFARNHATVIHGHRLVQDRLKADASFRQTVMVLQQRLAKRS